MKPDDAAEWCTDNEMLIGSWKQQTREASVGSRYGKFFVEFVLRIAKLWWKLPMYWELLGFQVWIVGGFKCKIAVEPFCSLVRVLLLYDRKTWALSNCFVTYHSRCVRCSF